MTVGENGPFGIRIRLERKDYFNFNDQDILWIINVFGDIWYDDK